MRERDPNCKSCKHNQNNQAYFPRFQCAPSQTRHECQPDQRNHLALYARDRHPRRPAFPIFWCTGEDSNLRSSKERQIYSLLPLTARPPVHFRRELPRSRFQNSSPPCSAQSPAFQSRTPLEPHSGSISLRCRGIFRSEAGPANPACILLCLCSWSWRRDLNPRPSDYKSDALPTELRQPKTGLIPKPVPDTRRHSQTGGYRMKF